MEEERAAEREVGRSVGSVERRGEGRKRKHWGRAEEERREEAKDGTWKVEMSHFPVTRTCALFYSIPFLRI